MEEEMIISPLSCMLLLASIFGGAITYLRYHETKRLTRRGIWYDEDWGYVLIQTGDMSRRLSSFLHDKIHVITRTLDKRLWDTNYIDDTIQLEFKLTDIEKALEYKDIIIANGDTLYPMFKQLEEACDRAEQVDYSKIAKDDYIKLCESMIKAGLKIYDIIMTLVYGKSHGNVREAQSLFDDISEYVL